MTNNQKNHTKNNLKKDETQQSQGKNYGEEIEALGRTFGDMEKKWKKRSEKKFLTERKKSNGKKIKKTVEKT